MTRRVCPVPGCPTLTDGGRCPVHRAEVEQARGTRQQRGYGAEHEAERARWAPLVASGHVRCWRCKQPIDPTKEWDLGHDDQDRTKHRGPEHPACNRATAGRRA